VAMAHRFATGEMLVGVARELASATMMGAPVSTMELGDDEVGADRR